MKTKDLLSNEIAALKNRHRIRAMRHEMNAIQGLVQDRTRKGSLHSDLDIAIRIINELLKERKETTK